MLGIGTQDLNFAFPVPSILRNGTLLLCHRYLRVGPRAYNLLRNYHVTLYLRPSFITAPLLLCPTISARASRSRRPFTQNSNPTPATAPRPAPASSAARIPGHHCADCQRAYGPAKTPSCRRDKVGKLSRFPPRSCPAANPRPCGISVEDYRHAIVHSSQQLVRRSRDDDELAIEESREKNGAPFFN
jgi:hypothetical protein